MRRTLRRIGRLFTLAGLASLVWLLVSLWTKGGLSHLIFIGIVLLILGLVLLRRSDAYHTEEPLSPSRRENQRKHKSWIENGKN